MTIASRRVRRLSLQDLGLQNLAQHEDGNILLSRGPDESALSATDPILQAVRRARQLGYAGVILNGPPGTGKTWYAQQLAVALAGTWSAVRSVQFHPSYQYEDFVFGYAPTKDGGFELREKEFVRICKDATRTPEVLHVLVIDEISRCDVARVFGEAFTYIEMDKRGQPFQTACGEELSVPANLLIVGTMNPWDKGVDELDMALERRFAQIDLYPDAEILRRLLAERGTSGEFVDRIIDFFRRLQRLPLNTVHIGHAYFVQCVDLAAAKQVWAFRLLPTLRRACQLDPAILQTIEENWTSLVENDALEVADESTPP